jgi:hypothetical protein
MDLGFFRRGRPTTSESSSARLDYDKLTATLQAFQSTSATAKAQALASEPEARGRIANAPLVELLTAGPEWRQAVDRQGGSFNIACARKSAPSD